MEGFIPRLSSALTRCFLHHRLLLPSSRVLLRWELSALSVGDGGDTGEGEMLLLASSPQVPT